LHLDPPTVAPTTLLHQEGVLALVAVVGLALRDEIVYDGLLPQGPWLQVVAIGTTVGALAAFLLWLARVLPAVAKLERWQAALVSDWRSGDAVAVAVFSGLAEEALLRALLQPLIGLVASALVFAVLHTLPDHRLWLWPVLAFVLGIVFGTLFTRWGYPAAAAGHITLNLIGLLRLVRRTTPSDVE
jgi:hypothetical protein